MEQNECKKNKQTKLTEQIKAWIVSQDTLIKQSGKTLAERCVLIHGAHPEIKLSSSFLCQKSSSQLAQKKIKSPLRLQQGIANYLLIGFTIVLIDETMFTYSTVLRREYSARNYNITLSIGQGKNLAIAVAAAISNTGGLEYFQQFSQSVNSERFISFCEELLGKLGAKDVIFIMDNLRVHHSKIVQEYLKTADIPVIFTPSYFPDSNPIENLFSLVKKKYKRDKLAAQCNNIKLDQKELVNESFRCNEEDILSLCKK